MGPENSNASEPFEPGKETDQQSVNDSLPSNAPVDPSLPSMMKSLTPNAPAISGDSAPQYPSLDAAVGVKQQAAPTLTNLLSATPQPPQNLLGATGMALASSTAMSQAASAQSLPDEQAPLTGQAIAVTQPDSSQEAIPTETTTPSQLAPDKPEVLNAMEHVVVSTLPEDSTNTVIDPQIALPAEPGENVDSASQNLPTDEGLATSPEPSQAESEADSAQAPADVQSDGGGDDNDSGDDNNSDSDSQAENNFDQVDEGAAEGDRARQVLIKREDDHVAIIFPEESANANPDVDLDFIDSQTWQDLQQRLSGGTAFASNTPVHLYSQNSLLDTRQLQELDEALGRFNLKLARIITSRRQTAVAAAMSGYSADQTNNLPELLSKEVHSPQSIGLAEPLYLQKTIRSGTEIRHPGSVVVMGDLNPGSSVIADGDILVWGRLRGIAHAGAAGNKASTIMALKLEATQLRIAGAVARVAAQSNGDPSPEIAYINDKSIRITSAYGFNRNALD